MSRDATPDAGKRLAEALRGRRVAVLTGAGCSTESGIPDYRGPGTARRARNPIQYREFVHSTAARRRYWARSVIGWQRIDGARRLLDEADALLVVGSSLVVFSGYRFVKGAAQRGLPVVVVNLGPTRGDPLATLKVEARAGTVLPRLLGA